MLKALKTATESFLLEVSVSATEITLLFPVPDSYLDSLRSFSLHMPLSAQPPQESLQRVPMAIVGKCDTTSSNEVSDQSQVDDPAQLILTTSYTRVALTILRQGHVAHQRLV